jgi:hypothetical protein
MSGVRAGRTVDVRPGSVIGRAWEIYKRQFLTLFGAAAAISLLTLPAGLVIGGLSALFAGVTAVFWELLVVSILGAIAIAIGLLPGEPLS